MQVSTTPSDDLAGELARTWKAPSLGTHFDHGVVTPLALGLLPQARVVAVSVQEHEDALVLADAIGHIAEKRPTKMVFVASAHTAAALTPRGPLVAREEAIDLEDRMLEEIPSDPGALVAHAQELDRVGGSCSTGTLAAFGRLFAGKELKVLAYDRSFGIGYLVASVGG